MNFLLDTCVLSELAKKSPEPSVVSWINSIPEQSLFLSILTFGEIQKGISRLPDSTKKIELQGWLDTALTQRFEGRILQVTLEIALHWGKILGTSEQKGIKVPVIDAMIASTAAIHHLTVVTRDTQDIAKCGVEVFNPWEKG